KLGPVPAYKKIDDETGPYVTTEHVPAESPAASTRQEERRRREKRYGPDPVYVKTAGEKTWPEKKSSSVF
ncbi:MAG: hypothetical protein NXI22_14390, partial [bacterium]|nr:hypothetical protein [bacterium]